MDEELEFETDFSEEPEKEEVSDDNGSFFGVWCLGSGLRSLGFEGSTMAHL